MLLSFFSVGSSDEDSSDEESSEKIEPTSKIEPVSSDSASLPSPLTALSSAKVPKFVTNHIKKDVDWNKISTKIPEFEPKENKSYGSALPAVGFKSSTKSDKTDDIHIAKQVPQTILVPEKTLKRRPPEAADHAVQWSKMYRDFASERKAYRPKAEEEDSDLKGFCHTDTSKDKVAFNAYNKDSSNSKSLSFREKERRKRSTGQSNRDKMFVEEEKRVLRQGFE